MRSGVSNPSHTEPVFSRQKIVRGVWWCALGFCIVLMLGGSFADNAKEGPKSPVPTTPFLDRDDPIFKAVADKKPLPEPLDNPGEFEAYLNVIRHTKRFDSAVLHDRAQPYVPLRSLIEENERPNHLRNLFHYDGRLVRLRSIEVPGPLVRDGIKELYEGWINVEDGGSIPPICAIFSELPKGLKTAEVMDEKVAFDGYYFKLFAYPAKGAKGEIIHKNSPLLIGRSIEVFPKDEAQVQSEAEQVKLPKGDRIYRAIQDKVRLAKYEENPREFQAYGDVVLQARKFEPEVLAKYSRRDVVYADLITDARDQFLRELLHVEGTLVRLRKREATLLLKDNSGAEIEDLYEGFVLFNGIAEQPIAVAFTDLPEGLQPAEQMHKRVSFDAYYFKLYAYETREKDKTQQFVWRVAPLMIGRSPKLLDEEPSAAGALVPVILIIAGVVVVAIVGLGIWFHRGDRAIRANAEKALHKNNPFEQETAEPPVLPGDAWNGLKPPNDE